MSFRWRRSSARVTLVLLGAAALAACGQEDDTLRRDVYASKEDCVQDWGDELKCEKPPVVTGYTPGFREAGRVAPATLLAALAVSVGVLDAACLTY